MRFEKIQAYLKVCERPFKYSEENDCGGIEFVSNGLCYHIWEYPEPERGAASNVRTTGRMEDYEGEDYEDQILNIIKSWSADSCKNT